jgi:hypothetical protein
VRAAKVPLILGLGAGIYVLLRAFLRGDYPPFGEQFSHALVGAAALALLGLGLAVLMTEVARLRFGEFPRWRQRLRTHSGSGRELETLALALSRDHFSRLAEDERRTRAQCWWCLHDLALAAERCGESTLRGWPSDRTPHPAIVEFIMFGRRWATVVLYGAGLLCLWQPAWQSGASAAPSAEAFVPGSWPLSSVGLFLAAAAAHFVPVWGLRRWLECSPRQVRCHYVPLAYLARARKLRRRIFSVLNHAGPPRLGDVLIDAVAPEIKAPVDAKDIVRRWLSMEEF